MNFDAVKDRGERLASALPPLLVRAERIAANVAPGLHGRQRAGRGETFWQFRPYDRTSDSAHAIDWRRSARSETLYVRESEWEASQTTWLWCDRSASMLYRSDEKNGETKADRAGVLTIALAALLVRGGEQVGLLGMNRRTRWGVGGLLRLVEAMAEEPSEDSLDLKKLPMPDRLSSVVLVSDFLTPPKKIDRIVRAMAANGIQGHLVRIYDPAEETLPFTGRVRFIDPESEKDILITRTEDVRKKYRKRFKRHGDAIAAIAQSVGWSYTVHRTDMPPETALMTLYAALAHDHSGERHSGEWAR